tara:strand:- start:4774 stop:5277 length:504 start_codon:yes stop_codon:yes gene_type:complete
MSLIKIQTSDLQFNTLREELYKYSEYLNNLVETSRDISSENEENLSIKLDNVDSSVFLKITDFLELYNNDPFQKIDKPLKSDDLSYCVGKEYINFLDTMEMELLFEVIKAANFLEIESLLDLTCAKVATMLKGKSVEEIRETFGIENDFTPEEEEEIKKENAWCENI